MLKKILLNYSNNQFGSMFYILCCNRVPCIYIYISFATWRTFFTWLFLLRFSSLLEKMGFSGMVKLHKGRHENDFDNYGIKIFVKYRDRDGFQVIVPFTPPTVIQRRFQIWLHKWASEQKTFQIKIKAFDKIMKNYVDFIQ